VGSIIIQTVKAAEQIGTGPPPRAAGVLALAVSDARAASTRYRLLAHLPCLVAAGLRPEVRSPLTLGRRGSLRRLYRAADLLRDLALARRFDLVWIQRKMYPPAVARHLGRPGGRVVLDLDDAVDLPPPDRACGARARRRFRRNFEATAGRADLVLCGNRELAARLPHARFEIVPTPIDTARFDPRRLRPTDRPVIGWVGHSSNFAYLEALAGPLREIRRRHPDAVVRVVADRPPALSGVPVEFERWTLEREVECFEGLRVGLMPLADTPWARAKCAFKAIQYMALGIPAVVSPVGMNVDLVRHGDNGWLAAADGEWIDGVDRLLGDAALRARLGAAGRRTVVERFSLEAVGARLAAILAALVAEARSGRPARAS